MEYRYTKHQVARGTRPDADHNNRMLLIKACSELRLTYQIRLLTFQAESRGIKLELSFGNKMLPSYLDFGPKRCSTRSLTSTVNRSWPDSKDFARWQSKAIDQSCFNNRPRHQHTFPLEPIHESNHDRCGGDPANFIGRGPGR